MSAIRQASLPGFDLGDYIKESIDFLRQHEPPEGYFVGFSGGKDSITTLELCRLAGVKHQTFYTYTTIDPPEVVRFIRAHYPQVHWLRPAKSFFACVATNAPPLRMQRWCCDHIKEKPSWNVPLETRLFGIRAEESVGRAERGRINVRVIRKGRGKKRKTAKSTPITTQYFNGQNGPYGNLSRQMACNIRHCMTKGSTAWAASAARTVLEKRLGQSCSGQSQCGSGPARGRLLSMPSSVGGKKRSEGCQNPPGETADSYWRDYLNGFEK